MTTESLEAILKRIDRIAHLIELDAKQEITKHYAQSIQALVQLAKKHDKGTS